MVPIYPETQRRLNLGDWASIILASALVSSVVIFLVTVFIAPSNLGVSGSGNNASRFGLRAGTPGEKVILVMGVDVNYSSRNRNDFTGTRTDTMMMVRVSPQKRTVSIVSIPRDSKVYLAENHGVDKINAAHAIGGADLAVQTVQDSFGIPIDNYMVINFQGVRELVDAVGGIDLYVDKAMHYRDNTAKLFIDFEPGWHQLDGKKAEGFLRFRHDAMADIGRIRRQQQFITAIVQKLKSPWILTRIPQIIQLANQYVDTDLTFDDMVRLAAFGKDVDPKDVRVSTLPGRPSGGPVSYWIIDPDAAQLVLDRLILDNPGEFLPAENTAANPNTPPSYTVGLLYPASMEAMLPELIAALERQQFKVVCKTSRKEVSTQIIEHSRRVNDTLTNTLRSSDRRLSKARLIFSPYGATYENNACAGSEDYTVMLGEDSQTPAPN